MQTLARLALLGASLSFALAGCAHRSASQSPPADAFFTEPPPQGVLTPVETGPGDHPPPKRKAPPVEATAPSAVADTAHLVPRASAQAVVEELPAPLTRVPPQYPDAARAARIQGTVQVQAFVKKDGSVGNVKVTVSVPGLDEAAMACVRQWTFKPGQTGGKPVEAWVGVPVTFRLP